MNLQLVILCALVMITCSTTFGQPVCLTLIESNDTLYHDCGNTEPLPDGTPVYIMQDRDPAGYGPEDSLALLCYDPPMCSVGPAGSLNYNTFAMNGQDAFGAPGLFFTTENLCPVNGQQPHPDRFYLRLNFPGRHLVSQVFPIMHPDGTPWGREIEMGPWTCINDLIPSCEVWPPERTLTLTPNHPIPGQQDVGDCFTLCHEFPTVMINVGPLGTDPNIAAQRRPRVTVGAGCDCEYSTEGFIWNGDFDGPWVLGLIGGQFYYQQTIVLPSQGSEGCAYAYMDFMLPIEMGNVSFTPLDNGVRIDWATRSESDLAHFEIQRNGGLVARIEARNSPTGASYSYTDESARNETTYVYSLSVVREDGSRETVATETVTPHLAVGIPMKYALYTNYPNPFNASTSIRFDVTEQGNVTIKVYDLAGRDVTTLLDGPVPAGRHEVRFDAWDLPSGVYICYISTGTGFHATNKMLLIK